MGELLTTVTWYNQGTHRVGQPGAAPQTPTSTAGIQECGSVPHQHPSSGRHLSKDPEKASKGTDQNQDREGREGLCRVPAASLKWVASHPAQKETWERRPHPRCEHRV